VKIDIFAIITWFLVYIIYIYCGGAKSLTFPNAFLKVSIFVRHVTAVTPAEPQSVQAQTANLSGASGLYVAAEEGYYNTFRKGLGRLKYFDHSILDGLVLLVVGLGGWLAYERALWGNEMGFYGLGV
jgi:hypothetical protein